MEFNKTQSLNKMKIIENEKTVFEALIQHKFCVDQEGQSSCIHNDEEKKLKIIKNCLIEEKIWRIEIEAKYCPYCGFSYQN